MNEALELAANLGTLFDRLGVAYCVGGSWASTLRGRPRQTLDIDLIVELRAEHVAPLCAALSPRYYVSAEAIHEALATHRAFNVIDPDTGMKADCFVRGNEPFDREEFSRRRIRTIDTQTGLALPVKSPEDSVLRKLLWFRDGGSVSDQQWHDVLGVLAVNAGELEEDYLDRWAAALSISDLLIRARVEAAR